MRFDPEIIKKDFPILARKIRDRDLVYLDSAATAQKPLCVIDKVRDFYLNHNSNVHRGAYLLSQEASEMYEGVRKIVCKFLGRQKLEEVIFTCGTTDAVNLVCTALERGQLGAFGQIGRGDDIVVTRMEHHANFVPWQQLAKLKGANFVITELTEEGRVDLKDFQEKLKGKPKVVAFTMMSNVLGVINPVREMALLAKKAGALVFVDAAQGIIHSDFQISDLGPIDFLAFSSHKVCGPSGVGVLWAREEVLWAMNPYRYGGDMIAKVGDAECTWNELPWKFEAGTPNIEGVIGFGEALEYLMRIGKENIVAHEKEICEYALSGLSSVEDLEIVGPKTTFDRGAVIGFYMEGIHPHDLATILDSEGIAMRAGHHCAQPLLNKLGYPATNRASFFIYNTKKDVDTLISALKGAQRFFRQRTSQSIHRGKSSHGNHGYDKR